MGSDMGDDPPFPMGVVVRQPRLSQLVMLLAMTSPVALKSAFDALDSCQTALDRLDAMCCEPGRSPRMKELGETLARARDGLVRFGDDSTESNTVLARLEDAGAQVGRLQVGCCAPNRLPLYTTFLEGLTTAQLSVNRELGLGH